MNLFERYLTIWVFLCIVVGIALGYLMPGVFQMIGGAEVAKVNIPVAVLIWLMVIPMLLKIDFAALGKVKEHWRGIGVTLSVILSLIALHGIEIWLYAFFFVAVGAVATTTLARPARKKYQFTQTIAATQAVRTSHSDVESTSIAVSPEMGIDPQPRRSRRRVILPPEGIVYTPTPYVKHFTATLAVARG